MQYTITVGSTMQEISFCIRHDQQPPSKIRLYNKTTSIAVFNFDKRSNSYIEMTRDELEHFDRGFKTGRCRHFSDSVSRETGDERLDKRISKLQRKLREKQNNGHQCSYCEEYGGVVNIEMQPSGSDARDDDVQIRTDDLKLSEPEAAVLGSTSIRISWQESVVNNEHLAKSTFVLQMSKSKSSSFDNIYSGPEQTFTKIDLLPGTKYFFRLRAVKDNIQGPFSPEVCVLTDATAPSTPDVPHISNKTKTSVLLKWTTKSDNGSPITSYVLQWDEGNVGDSCKTIYQGSQKQYKFNHKLAPMASCRFRVKAINKIGESQFSAELRYTANAAVPSTPDPPTLIEATASSLQLSWNKPNTNGAEITEYILQMDDENKGYGFLTVYRGNDKKCNVDDKLKRNMPYKFRLSAINAQGESKWSDIVIYSTISEAPGRMSPPVLEGKVHAKSFVVTWVPSSDDGGSEIVDYSLEINDGKGGPFHEAYTGLDMEYKFQDLLPGHMYKVRVSCASSGFRSPWSETANIKTLPVIPNPPSAPRELKNYKPQPYTIEVQWDPPSYNGGVNITSYNVQMKKSNEEDFRPVYLGLKNSCFVSGLLSHSEYSFRVRAKNSAGDSKYSEISFISTGPGPPDRVQQLEIVCRSSNTLKIFWKVPKDNGTPVTGYVLEWATSFNGPFEKSYNGVDNKYDLKKNILPSTVYYFRVQALSSAGYGEWSDTGYCKTPAAPPAQVTHLKLVRQTCTSLTLQWREPSNSGATITSYNIDTIDHEVKSYVLNGSESAYDVREDNFNTLEYTLSDLLPHTQYRFRVQGVNKSGCGAFSSVISATTGSVPPDAPALEMVNSSYQSIKLHWIFLRTRNETSEIVYDLQMRCKDTGSFETVFKGLAMTCKVGKLREQTLYSFRIRSANEAGFGPYSDIFICQTGVQPPSSVKGFNYSNLNSNNVTLSWKDVSPVHSTDRINYILQWQRKDVAELEQLYEGNQTAFVCSNLTSEQTYSFRVCAVRILSDGRRIQSVFTSLISLTVPSEIKESVLDPTMSQKLSDEEPQVRQLSEKQLALMFFFGFATLVLLMSLLISFAVG